MERGTPRVNGYPVLPLADLQSSASAPAHAPSSSRSRWLNGFTRSLSTSMVPITVQVSRHVLHYDCFPTRRGGAVETLSSGQDLLELLRQVGDG